MKATHAEIARRAKVSRTAVSFALNGTGRLEAETRRRIIEIAEELGYRRNLLVQGIQTGRTQTVGVMVRVESEFAGKMLTGVQDALAEADYVSIAVSVASPTLEIEQILRLIDQRVDGVILRPATTGVSDAYLREVWDRDIPMVTIDMEVPQTEHVDFSGTDDALGGRMAAEHLLGLGHRRLGMLARPNPNRPPCVRQHAFARAVAAVADAHCSSAPALAAMSVVEPALSLLRETPRPTAVFVPDDRLALAVYEAAHRLGLRIPEDLSVVGFADLAFVAYMSPPLTTLRQDPYSIGRAAAEQLLRRIKGETTDPKPHRHRLAPELIVRGSTAPPQAPGSQAPAREDTDK